MNNRLFIPLKTEFFEAFKRGSKNTEYRVYGPRWNERTCFVGRPVTISKGYGKYERLQGVVTRFRTSSKPTLTNAWKACYGHFGGALAACITIRLATQSAKPGVK